MRRAAFADYECSVCGLPFRSGWILLERLDPLPRGFDDEGSRTKLEKGELWMDDAVLLCDPDDEMGQLIPSFTYENLSDDAFRPLKTHTCSVSPLRLLARSSDIEEYTADHRGGPWFYFYETNKVTRKVNVHHQGFPTFDGRPYIPVHSACLHIAKLVFKYSSHKYISNMRSLFLALRWRHAISRKFGAARQEANYKLGLTCWYRPYEYFWECRRSYEYNNSRTQLPRPTRDAEFNILYTFLSNPIEIEDLTGTLLSNLQPCRHNVVGQEACSFQTHLAALPNDVFQIILSHLRSFRDLPRRTNYTLPQHFWKNELMLAREGLLPWLWDIEPDKVNSKASERCPGGEGFEWNWELLVRQLSRGVDGGIRPDVPEHVDIYAPNYDRGGPDSEGNLWTFTGYHNDLKHVPRGLHNRRRIWQLLEEMFVGDQLPLAGETHREPETDPVPPMQECVELPWTKCGGLRKSSVWLPSISRDGSLVRKIGGRVYKIRNDGSLQYWQTEEFRRLRGEELDKPAEPAGVADVLGVIRELRYPV